VYFRRQLGRSARDFVTLGLAPLIGSLALVFVLGKSAVDLADPAASAGGTEWLGLGAPLVIALALVLVGLAGMLAARIAHPAFFAARPEAAPEVPPDASIGEALPVPAA